MRLTDSALVESLQNYVNDNISFCAFLQTERVKDCLDNMYALVKGGTRTLQELDQKQSQDLWRELVTASINVLKWRDKRENRQGSRQPYEKWLRSTLGHGAFGINELDDYFKAFVGFERVLYGAEAYYRDHFLHVIRVWLIGVYVAENQFSIEEFAFDLHLPQNAKPDADANKKVTTQAMWPMCILRHVCIRLRGLDEVR